ncbi:hypothetical protein AcW1_003618 [Taiwanofungus camphoratus]|nr:hypothetical protein AcV5_007309 [Antrodia cinnamomea]KAI0940420.1 hypothetical protein AcW1_003618 [Antrodia cinnamomea]KAI0958406.1 hypothetical protein AcV7_004237 [Antrodia cinnamomea]
MASDSDVLSYLLPLDELIQVIYQGSSRFVVISGVEDTSWTVHVGLSGSDGRWWRGRWTEKDILKAVGSKASSKMLETFVDRLADTFVQGELFIDNWSLAKGVKINLTLSPDALTPLCVPLTELSSHEASSFATKIFTDIAVQAQSRKCRLYPSPHDTKTASVLPQSKTIATRFTAGPSEASVYERKAEDEIRKLKSELAKARSQQNVVENTLDTSKGDRKRKPEEEADSTSFVYKKTQLARAPTDSSKLLPQRNGGPSAVVAPKGASLANPLRKARKYQVLEFESDED